MNINLHRTAAALTVLSLLAGLPASAGAQDLVAMPPEQQVPPPVSPDQQFQQQYAPPPQAAPQTPVAQAPVYSQAQIDQLLAPIALYPDPLIGQIMMASTYPLEVVEASRWLQDSNNAALKGDDLANAMQQQTWDPSVKSLVAFPQVLQMMNGNLQWTEQLGDAFLAQQPQVMSEVQHLRQQAQAAGNLNSTPQQTVATQGPDIVIQPAQPQVVYVPVYNPQVVYGAWAYPAYPPYYFPQYYYPGVVFAGGALIGFGIGFAIVDPLWGWWHWDWYHHHIDIDDHRFADLNRGHGPIRDGVWAHDPDHRRGVPYRDAATRAHFLGAAANSPEARRTFRGFPAASAQNRTAQFNAARTVRPQAMPVAQNGFHAQNNARVNSAQQMQRNNAQRESSQQQMPAQRSPTSMQRSSYNQRPAAPMYESFTRGNEVQAQSARGAVSRSSAASFHAAAPMARSSAPAHAAAPARSGGGGGGNRGGNSGQRGQH